MAKDPAFLFYSKDWLEGTAEMTPAEKGVYIDLLAHQHQKGSLPSEINRLCKLAGLSQGEFEGIWAHLSTKFVETKDNRLVNRKLTDIVTDRSTKSLTNKITGTLASVIRLRTDVSPEIKEKIKKLFNVNDFLTVPTDSLTVYITEWFTLRLKSIANANANTVELGGVGERDWNQKPGPDFFDLILPPVQVSAAIESVRFTKQLDITPEKVTEIWATFKKQHFTGKKFYQDKEEAFNHFINWLKKQEIKLNGSHKAVHVGGTSTDRTEALKGWGLGGK